MSVAFIHSTAWQRVKKQLKADRQDYLNQLVNNQPELETALLRGRLQIIDELLDRYPSECSEREDQHEYTAD